MTLEKPGKLRELFSLLLCGHPVSPLIACHIVSYFLVVVVFSAVLVNVFDWLPFFLLSVLFANCVEYWYMFQFLLMDDWRRNAQPFSPFILTCVTYAPDPDVSQSN